MKRKLAIAGLAFTLFESGNPPYRSSVRRDYAQTTKAKAEG